MSTTVKMMIVQPENKSLLVRNASGDPLDLSSAGDIVRGNASQPSNGELLYLFTSATEVSVNGEPSVSVTTDGSTYNNDIGGKGVDIVFKSGRVSGDLCQVDVSNKVDGKDTYLRSKNAANNNFGRSSNIAIRDEIAFPRSEVGLIKFTIPSVVKNVLSVFDASLYFFLTDSGGSSFRVNTYVISNPNSDWVEGNGSNTEAQSESTYNDKLWPERIEWVGLEGLQDATDRESPLLSNPLRSSGWNRFPDNSNNLINYAERMIDGDNAGFLMESEGSGSANQHLGFESSDVGDSIRVRRPKMVIVYDETDAVVIKRAKKGLAGFLSLDLGDIDRIVKAEIPALSNISEVYRSANRVIGRINSLFPGVMETELAFTRKLANTTENLTFESANPDTIVTTSDLSASALPGRVVYIYGTQYNNGLYYVGSVSTVTITLVGDSKLIAETVSATIAIYDVKAQEIFPETNTILTHTTTTMTDSGLNDFERMGVKEDDIVILVGSSRNDGAYSIASSNGLEITLQSDESLTAVGPSYARLRIIRPSLAYQFDTENNELKLPDYVKEIVKVFENDKELTPRSFEYTNNPNNSSKLAFNTKERSIIRFPSGIGGNAGDEIHVKVKKDIIEFLYVDSLNSIVVPALMEEVIIAGTLSLIYANPKYRDMNLFKFNNDIYVRGLKEMIDLEIEYSPSVVAKRDYDYFPGVT